MVAVNAARDAVSRRVQRHPRRHRGRSARAIADVAAVVGAAAGAGEPRRRRPAPRRHGQPRPSNVTTVGFDADTATNLPQSRPRRGATRRARPSARRATTGRSGLPDSADGFFRGDLGRRHDFQSAAAIEPARPVPRSGSDNVGSDAGPVPPAHHQSHLRPAASGTSAARRSSPEDGDRDRAPDVGDVLDRGPPDRGRASTTSASRPAAGSAPSRGTPPGTSRCTSRSRAPGASCTRSTSATSPTSSSTRSTTPRTRRSSSTARCCRCSASTCRGCTPCSTWSSWTTAPTPNSRRPAHRPVPRTRRWRGAPRSTSPTGSPTSSRRAALCYTTGTTGNPKGVLYSHRSTWLHSCAATTTACSASPSPDRVLPVVPMFHANAWGLPYACLMAGASLVMPGPDLSPARLIELFEAREGHRHGGRPDDLDGHAVRCSPAATCPACARSSVAARRCPSRCPRRTGARRSGCRSCRPGA